MKLLLGVLIVCFTSYCGYFLSKKYQIRKLFFIQLYEFNEYYLNEISYFRRPLPEILKRRAYKGAFGDLLNGYFGVLKENSTKKTAIYSLISAYDFLTEDEKGIIGDYFSMLGSGDSNSQKEYFSSVKNSLAERKSQSVSNAEKYGGLFIKLGFLFGLTILILIV
jgi:stage III sporulation protein AB